MFTNLVSVVYFQALGRGTTQEHPASRQPTSQPATDEEEGAHCPALIPKAVKQRRGGKIHSVYLTAFCDLDLAK